MNNAKSNLLLWVVERIGQCYCFIGFCLAMLYLPLVALAATVPIPANTADIGQTFTTPEQAVAALTAAVNGQDLARIHIIFGPAYADIINHDRVQATNEFNNFAAALKKTNYLERVSDDKRVLEVGLELWPFPIPLVRKQAQWYFDTEAGKEEILNRRIGRNELAVLEVVRAYVQAQREYACRDHNGDEVLEFAQHLISAPGKKDGLYWLPEMDGELSPLGPLFAQAQCEGYTPRKSEAEKSTPFHGYYFKILTRQGKHTPGGRYDYVINGRMIAGFALVAWPAAYGETGIMTFIVNQQGRVYEKDLGPKTDKLARGMKEYDPDPTWELSPD